MLFERMAAIALAAVLATPAVAAILVERLPQFAIRLIEGLVAKSKCYSALVQMLGTRSATQRLAQLLVILAELYGKPEIHFRPNRLVLQRKVTHDQLAMIVGVTRQWVTTTLDRFQQQGVLSVGRQTIVVERPDLLVKLAA